MLAGCIFFTLSSHSETPHHTVFGICISMRKIVVLILMMLSWREEENLGLNSEKKRLFDLVDIKYVRYFHDMLYRWCVSWTRRQRYTPSCMAIFGGKLYGLDDMVNVCRERWKCEFPKEDGFFYRSPNISTNKAVNEISLNDSPFKCVVHSFAFIYCEIKQIKAHDDFNFSLYSEISVFPATLSASAFQMRR